MLTAYSDCGWNKDLLKCYLKYEVLQDDISHLLAIKVCTNLNDYAQGQGIINDKLAERGLSKSIGLNGALINFYGTFGDIEKQNIF